MYCESFEFMHIVADGFCCSKHHFFMSVLQGERKDSKEVLLSTTLLFLEADLYKMSADFSLYPIGQRRVTCPSETSYWHGMMGLP